MKSLLVLLLLAVAAFAQTNVVSMHAGTNNGTTWNPPVLDENASPPTCTAGTVTAYGAYFDYNVSVAGVFHVSVMTEGDFDSYVEVFAYMHPFDPQTPCTNVIIKEWQKEIGQGGGPVIADFAYMAVGRYWFVVTSNTADTVGQVAIHVYPPLATGSITASSPQWDTAYDSSGCVGGAGGSGYPHFSTFTWTQNGTGQYDLTAGFYNATYPQFSYTYLTLYTGSVTTAAITADSCANYIWGDYTGGMGVTLWNITLTNGQAYTVAMSGEYDTEFGYYGFWAVPTRTLHLIDTPTWTQPQRTDNCTAGTNAASWYASAVVSSGQVMIIDTQTLPSGQGFTYVDTYSWFFRGNQSTASPPPTCGGRVITYGDTGDVTPVYGITVAGRIYTTIVSTYSGGTNTGEVALFTYSGVPLGFIPPSDETTGDGADGSSGADGGDGGDGSAASGLYVSLLLTAVCALAARFF